MAEKPALRLRLGISNLGEEGWSIHPQLDNDFFSGACPFLLMGTFPQIRWGWTSEQIVHSILSLEGDESPEEKEYYLRQLNEESTKEERQMQSAINSTWIKLQEIVDSLTRVRSDNLSFKQAHEKIGELMMRIEEAHKPIDQAWEVVWKKFLRDNPNYNGEYWPTWEEFVDSRPE
ncbi:hypothetical protein [Shimazuella alba]|uniref:Uncharacterized protein n=1 Tax=Shimazuella alba TaxID=2690964 RepID=A0A6I4VXW0_9BACL|nr:hypothetical protein [Shimazuella alba]MXQ53294.1 hypothetical protein [Shimazuella alba]